MIEYTPIDEIAQLLRTIAAELATIRNTIQNTAAFVAGTWTALMVSLLYLRLRSK